MQNLSMEELSILKIYRNTEGTSDKIWGIAYNSETKNGNLSYYTFYGSTKDFLSLKVRLTKKETLNLGINQKIDENFFMTTKHYVSVLKLINQKKVTGYEELTVKELEKIALNWGTSIPNKDFFINTNISNNQWSDLKIDSITGILFKEDYKQKKEMSKEEIEKINALHSNFKNKTLFKIKKDI